MGQDHAPAAVTLAAELIERISVHRLLDSDACLDSRVCMLMIELTYPSGVCCSSTSLTNLSQRSAVTLKWDQQEVFAGEAGARVPCRRRSSG